MQVVVFLQNNHKFGICTSKVKEILTCHEVQSTAGMPNYMEGMINLRGQVIPIVSLNKRFDFNQPENAEANIIIADVGGNPIGLKVDKVDEILTFTEENLDPVPEILNRGKGSYLQYIAKKDEKLISIINPEKLLSSSEVEEVIQKVQQ
jgi:purine-binding chemotaxis protein CheW